MNATEAKALLEPIPDVNWTTKTYTDLYSRCCAVGHLERLLSPDPDSYIYRDMFKRTKDKIGLAPFIKMVSAFNGSCIYSINDGEDPRYPESTPKARILHLLDDMIAAGY